MMKRMVAVLMAVMMAVMMMVMAGTRPEFAVTGALTLVLFWHFFNGSSLDSIQSSPGNVALFATFLLFVA